MIKTFIKTHIINYTVDKLIDSICDNLGLYPDMDIKIITIFGSRIYAELSDYTLEISKPFLHNMRTQINVAYKVIDKIPTHMNSYIIKEDIVTIPYSIDNQKIANSIVYNIDYQYDGLLITGTRNMEYLKKLVHRNCTTIDLDKDK